MSEASRPEEDDIVYDERWPLWMRDWVLPYVLEPALLPVLIAIAGHFVVIYALMLVSVYREGWAGSWGWLAFSVASSSAPAVWEITLFKRPGGINLVVALTWISAILMAWSGLRSGWI
ncbi:MAG: hypothetical protein EP330_24105 [Deltaproteobacteria bacterium]|nr:MAG: hypothetical protein EP330_24105 [Deltaproteobacteria bacterium]